jgi:REP element-mobilizing transposase RayT
MANTYTQIYLHVVFTVSGRACVISSAHREELQKYITGIVTRKGQKLIAIYCMRDHTHALLGLEPNIAASDLIGDIKTGSSNHINEQRWMGCHFHGRRAAARFPFLIRIWIVWRTIFPSKGRIIAESHSSRNMFSSWSGITSHTISVIFSSQLNNPAV